MKNTLVINLWGGPSSGKSTMMANIFAGLKWLNVDCEMAPEYAKELVWDNSMEKLSNQMLVTATQYERVRRLYGKVDVIITDSPILLGLIYADGLSEAKQTVIKEMFSDFEAHNVFVKRLKPFNPNGRLQNEKQAKEVDVKVQQLLRDNDINFDIVDGTAEGALMVAERIDQILKQRTARLLRKVNDFIETEMQ